jgi:hypothetical protein
MGSDTKVEVLVQVTTAGEKLKETVKKVEENFVNPVITALEKEIKALNAEIDGLDQEAKDKVAKAFKQLLDADNCIRHNRRVLSAMAEDTISRIGTLKMYFGLLVDDVVVSDGEATKETIRFAVDDFMKMQKRVMVQLEEAKTSYKEAIENLNSVKANMKRFSDAVNNVLTNNKDDYGESLRKKVYPALIAAGPIGLAIGAAIVEAKIKEWEKKMKQLSASCHKALAAANNVTYQADSKIEFINGELDIIQNWQNAVQQTLDSESKMTWIATMVDTDNIAMKRILALQQQTVSKVLDNLKKICEEYLAHSYEEEKKVE